MNSADMLQDFAYYSGKLTLSSGFSSISETKTHILKNVAYLNGCFYLLLLAIVMLSKAMLIKIRIKEYNNNSNNNNNNNDNNNKNCKETKGFSPLSFVSLIFICSDVINSNTVPCKARISQSN